MTKKGVRGRLAAAGSAVAAGLLLTLAVSPAASADTMRTLNLNFRCATGEPYGIEIATNESGGWYTPDGSSYAVGDTKYFTIYIPASATTFYYMPLSCAGEPVASNPSAVYRPISLTAGTSTINATGFCQDYSFYGYLLFDCTVSSLTYG